MVQKERFRLVCRGALKRIRTNPLPYKSILLHRKEPYLILGPFRIEILSSSPIKLLVHDFFKDCESEWLKNYASMVFDTPNRVENPEQYGKLGISFQSNAVELNMHGPNANLSDRNRLS